MAHGCSVQDQIRHGHGLDSLASTTQGTESVYRSRARGRVTSRGGPIRQWTGAVPDRDVRAPIQFKVYWSACSQPASVEHGQ